MNYAEDVSDHLSPIFRSLVLECSKPCRQADEVELTLPLRKKIEDLPLELRKVLVSRASREYDGCSPLFLACRTGKVLCVEYLIRRCGADIEQRCLYRRRDADIEQRWLYKLQMRVDKVVWYFVTPLWCASVAGQLNVVKFLVEHGANINSTSDTGSTAVRSACFMTHINVVSYLISQGADITLANHTGGTCLTNSIQSVQLCELLLDHGADVNAQDFLGKTALHYSIEECHYMTTKFLLNNNADPFIQNIYGDDALQTACLRGSDGDFEILLEMVDYNSDEIVEAYDLFGSTVAIDSQDPDGARVFWDSAMRIRKAEGIVKKHLAPKHVYSYISEFDTVNDLLAISQNDNILRLNGLIMNERILGTAHKDMVHRLMQGAETYVSMAEYQKGIDLWLYGVELKINNQTILPDDTCCTLLVLVKLYLDLARKRRNVPDFNLLQFDDVYKTLKLILPELYMFTEELSRRPVFEQYLKNLSCTIRIIVHLLDVMIQFPDRIEDNSVTSFMEQLVKLDPRDDEGNTLLHLVVMKQRLRVLDYMFWDPYEILKYLLKLGANIDARGKNGQSVLSALFKPHYYDVKMANIVLEAEPHIDQSDDSGWNPVQALIDHPNHYFQPLKHINLKCFACRVIRRHKIPYKGELPKTLEKIVDMH